MREAPTSWDELNDRPPAVRIERWGRFPWATQLTHGLLAIGPDGGHWVRWSERAAQAKGRRELRRYLRKGRWTAESYVLDEENQ
jgi:hypothetical protein